MLVNPLYSLVDQQKEFIYTDQENVCVESHWSLTCKSVYNL